MKDVARSIFDLWNLMDATKEQKIKFLKITSILDLTDSAIMEPGSLSMEIIEQVWRHHHNTLPTLLHPVDPRLCNIIFILAGISGG